MMAPQRVLSRGWHCYIGWERIHRGICHCGVTKWREGGKQCESINRWILPTRLSGIDNPLISAMQTPP
ncbi:hypothetical protein AFLA_002028 [Aspergillus flavus NRRL3357]|nr:hypothetical protein AFLA_002028 [Aspergillus flavus NRRL3357]